MVTRFGLLRKMAVALVACLAVVLLPSQAWAVDCVGPDDPPGCVTPVPTPTVTVTEFASPTATPTVTETATATTTAVATVLPTEGVMLAPGQVVVSALAAPQLSVLVAGIGLVLMVTTASMVTRLRGGGRLV